MEDTLIRQQRSYGRRCWYCGCILVSKAYLGEVNETIDHIIPVSRGGNNTAYNKVLACKRCNMLKGGMTPQEFKEFLIKRMNEGYFSEWSLSNDYSAMTARKNYKKMVAQTDILMKYVLKYLGRMI